MAALLVCIVSSGQEYLYFLSDRDDYHELCGIPLSVKYGQVDAIKVVYDTKDDQIYYINAKYFKYHHEFCRDFLDYDLDLWAFNSLNYSDKAQRKYLLGNVNHFKAQDVFVLEISPVDQMGADQIHSLYKAVGKSSWFGDSLLLILNSTRLNRIKNDLDPTIITIEPSDLYYNLNYQSVSNYSSTGVLRYINDITNAGPRDILILDRTPDFLPLVSGIILTEFQTPLSHMTILGRNRKIPVCVYKTALTDSGVMALLEEKVRLTVKHDTFNLITVDKLVDIQDTKTKVELKKNIRVYGLLAAEDLNRRSADMAGNKAANFGELCRLSRRNGFKTPESAFAIPFYYYEKHIRDSGADSLIAGLLDAKNLTGDDEYREKMLEAVRKRILDHPPDAELLHLVKKKIVELGDYKAMRFRSSTNAEDAPGFSGAGLYTSKTGILGDSVKTIEKAILKVWASLWSYPAFMEREYFHIDHNQVSMGILVHRSFPDEEVNGVAITRNIYRENGYGFVVNAQLGDVSVVDPAEGFKCDQFICYPDAINFLYREKNVIDVITYSNLNRNRLVMTEEEIQHLANQLERIKQHFYSKLSAPASYIEFGLDVEFKLQGPDRELYIKQVRYYND